MAVRIRCADLAADREDLLAVLGRNLQDVAHRRRFGWLYQGNPVGRAWSWLARDVSSDEAVGVASLFPRAVWLGSRVALCGQVGDFAVDVTHRSLGPAMMLQRATFEPVQRGEIAFCYDCPPHERGMSTFRRLGMTVTTTMQRRAKLLRVERQLGNRFGKGRLWARVGPIGNALLRLTDRRPRRVSGVDIDAHTGRFGEEFSRLDQRIGGRGGIRGRRAAEDLNWRYREDPLHEYEVFTARRHGEVVGFVVVGAHGEDGIIVDLFADPESGDVARVLLETAAAHFRGSPVQSVHARISEGSSLAGVFDAAGFRLRERGPHVVAYKAPTDEGRQVEGQLGFWDFVHADVMA
jgi:hypothetical protein